MDSAALPFGSDGTAQSTEQQNTTSKPSTLADWWNQLTSSNGANGSGGTGTDSSGTTGAGSDSAAPAGSDSTATAPAGSGSSAPVPGDSGSTPASEPTDSTSTGNQAAPAPVSQVTPSLPASVKTWEEHMIADGKKWGDRLSSGSAALRDTYYDASWVYFQIADYTGQKEPWLSYAAQAKKIYRDNYAEPNNYKLPGYWRFPHGLYEDYVRGGDTTVEQIAKMRDNPAFSNPEYSSYAWKWYHAAYAREVAYAIQANVIAEKAGMPRKEARMQRYLEMAANQMDQWRRNDYTSPSRGDTSLDFLQPFMFSLTAHALIEFYEWERANGRDPDAYFKDIPGRLASFAKWLYEDAVIVAGPGTGKRLWIGDVGGTGGAWNDKGGTGYGAFRYKNKSDSTESGPTPDLNLLMAPVYAWLYDQTGDMGFREKADRIFSSGVALGGVGWNAKIFDQNYRWSMRYVEWRKEGDRKWLK